MYRTSTPAICNLSTSFNGLLDLLTATLTLTPLLVNCTISFNIIVPKFVPTSSDKLQ
ncbi:hypothetical protein [Vaccinia virus]|uniref:Uncharacterized protein n=1 Tax=Vaccinia virus TaxID=10245 RepID=A0A2I6J106_VACCV|nr:hypothetical protein [Vaccinia virus]